VVENDDVLVEYHNVKDLYVLLMQFAVLKDWKTAAQRLCCERELLGVTASVGTKIAPLVSDFTEPGDYAMCCKAPDFEKWLKAMIKEIKELERMGCRKIVKLTSLPLAPKLSIALVLQTKISKWTLRTSSCSSSRYGLST